MNQYRDMCWRDCIFSKKQPCLLHIERICPGFVSPKRAGEKLNQIYDAITNIREDK